MARTVWAWARVLGGLGILAVLLWRLGTGAFVAGLRVIDGPTLLLAFAIGLGTTVCSAWRWCLVARGLGLRLSLRTAVADYYKALFVNATLPCGVLGDVDRAVRHGREEGDVGRGVRAVVLERTAGQVVLVAVGLGVLLTVPSPVLSQLRAHGPAAVAAGAAAAGVAALAWSRLRRGASRVAGAARAGVAEVRSALLARRAWPQVALASAVVLAGHLATFLVAARVAGSTASLPRLAPLLLLALLAMGLPVNVGGWGPREGVTAWAFGAAGLSASQGLTIAVVYGLFAFVAALPGAAVLAGRAAARLRAAAAAREPQPAPPQATLPPAAVPPAAVPPAAVPPAAIPQPGAAPVPALALTGA
jgi:uncharacterized membrane protein YbhN (UPF0104 family)